MARPDIGALDQRVTFQSFSVVSNGMGGQDRTWADLPSIPTVWANVRAKGGGEQMEADRMNATQLHLFTVRNRTDVTEKDRIVWAGETYNIRRVERMGTRAMYLVIEAERGAAA